MVQSLLSPLTSHVSCYNHLLISSITLVAMEAGTYVKKKKKRKKKKENHILTAAATPLLFPNHEAQQDATTWQQREIIWALIRMMSLCICILATDNKLKHNSQQWRRKFQLSFSHRVLYILSQWIKCMFRYILCFSGNINSTEAIYSTGNWIFPNYPFQTWGRNT